MVLMKNPYKDDRQLEEELREAGQARAIVKRLCLPDTLSDSLYERLLGKEERHPASDMTRVLKKMEMQEKQIRYLLGTVELLQQRKGFEQTRIVVVEEISKDEGKKLVEAYFKEHGTADIEELMINLQISVQTLVEIIDELRTEGKLIPHQDEMEH
jgi:signal recognition particle GTPase